MAQATIGGGCFWCLEALLNDIDGVEQVVSGYSGGNAADADYRSVCSGNTDHAEVVQVTFDPDKLSYRELVTLFFAGHNPTTLNRQGNDVGRQYRSVIFHHDAEQQATAQAVISELNPEFDNSIVTELTAYEAFYPAEEYHQDYYARNRAKPYCQVVISPKLAKFRQRFAQQLK